MLCGQGVLHSLPLCPGRGQVFCRCPALGLQGLQKLFGVAHGALANLLGEAQRLLALRLQGLVAPPASLHSRVERGPSLRELASLPGKLPVLQSEVGLQPLQGLPH